MLLLEEGGRIDGGAGLKAVEPDWETALVPGRDGTFRPLGKPWSARALGGGMRLFAGIGFRFREVDFDARGHVAADALDPRWPIGYGDLRPGYDEIEGLFGIARADGADPLEPPAAPPRMPPHPFSAQGAVLAEAGTALGLRPFPTPLLINSVPYRGRPACVHCGPCNEYACPVGAKADVAETLLRTAARGGTLTIATRSKALRIGTGRFDRADHVEWLDLRARRRHVTRARIVVLAANAVQSAALLLRSGNRWSPDGLGNRYDMVGRGLCFKVSGYANATVPSDRVPSAQAPAGRRPDRSRRSPSPTTTSTTPAPPASAASCTRRAPRTAPRAPDGSPAPALPRRGPADVAQPRPARQGADPAGRAEADHGLRDPPGRPGAARPPGGPGRPAAALGGRHRRRLRAEPVPARQPPSARRVPGGRRPGLLGGRPGRPHARPGERLRRGRRVLPLPGRRQPDVDHPGERRPDLPPHRRRPDGGRRHRSPPREEHVMTAAAEIRWDRALGAHAWDASGARHIDLTSCSGAAPLGAGYEPVLDRVVAELRRTGGVVPEPASALRAEVAGRLARIVPAAETVEFFRTGSCATTAAVRVARLHTAARTVLTSGYHGWHDWQLQYRPAMALPDRDPDTADFGYDLDELDRLARRRGPVAAVIVTPEVNFFPPEYLRELARLTRDHGALLIVDEVMTGFRYAWGGYSAAAGVAPDLLTVSKGLANGFALSAVAGRADVMAAAARTHLGNTYQRETTPYAAALATLDASADAVARMGRIGAALMDGLNGLFLKHSVEAWALSHPTMFDVVFADPEEGRAFFRRVRDRGFVIGYGQRFMPSAALTDSDVDAFLSAAASELPGAAGERAGRPGGAAAAAFAGEFFAASPASVSRWSMA
ncbi:aminotransferase class III-fold pyridoxal phosphate-dependent enzyme [Actinomadura madurae]|nr:aminotransferase class III-fold pyridoxal phosphate-dependent enzyme [Actinomadura madurae]